MVPLQPLCRDRAAQSPSGLLFQWHWVCHHHSWYRDLAGRADPADKGPPLVHAGIVSRPCHALQATGSITSNTFLHCLALQTHTDVFAHPVDIIHSWHQELMDLLIRLAPRSQMKYGCSLQSII